MSQTLPLTDDAWVNDRVGRLISADSDVQNKLTAAVQLAAQQLNGRRGDPLLMGMLGAALAGHIATILDAYGFTVVPK